MEEKIRVLMVDDEEQFRETTKKILNRRGFETLIAGSAEEALDLLQEKPDVIILDIRMPGMDGHEALRQFKKRAKEIPVIMLTGHGGESSAKAALSEGAFDYLLKPCEMELLASKISEAGRASRGGNPLEEKKVSSAMIPLDEYERITPDVTVAEAIGILRDSFSGRFSTSRIMETGHHSILVMDEKEELLGIISIRDIIEGLMPEYLSAPKPSLAESIQYSVFFWKGLFTTRALETGKGPVTELMSSVPPSIDGDSNLMEATHMMVNENARRLAVFSQGKFSGVIREQDLLFEFYEIIRRKEGVGG